MDAKLSYLFSLGFVLTGRWSNFGNAIVHNIPAHAGIRRNVLYAFAVDENPVYIGMTVMQLKERMRRYAHPAKKPGNGGGTNIKNNRNIQEALRAGRTVDILFLAGLYPIEEEPAPKGSVLHSAEQQLRRILQPQWNDI
ncbi:hypothetical protein EGT07_14375 [Herbaspirillum sp. HC18]|nr:hypothetical protein EGT07_14375 [Herbaspirillum sp. HC18]